MTCTALHTLEACRRADAAAKRNLREAEREFKVTEAYEQDHIIYEASKAKAGKIDMFVKDVKNLGANIPDQTRNMLLMLHNSQTFCDAEKRLIAAQEQAAACAVDLAVALDERDERKLAARERFTDVLAVAFGVSGPLDPDNTSIDAVQDEYGERSVEAIIMGSKDKEAALDAALQTITERVAEDHDEPGYEMRPATQVDDRIAQLEAQIARMQPIVDAAIAWRRNGRSAAGSLHDAVTRYTLPLPDGTLAPTAKAAERTTPSAATPGA